MTKNLIKLKFIILIIIASINGCANSEAITGYWSGVIEMNSKKVDLVLDLNSDRQTFSSYNLMLLEQPISNLKVNNGNVSFSLVLDVEMNFNGELKNDSIIGTIEMQNGPPNMNMAFSLIKHSKTPEKPYFIEKLNINSNDIFLSAEIYTPKTEGVHPAIVLLQGSSTNLKIDYVFDADFFAKLGFEVLIFDKRGSGKSTGDYYTANYDDLVNDAVACLEVFNNKESVNKNKIGLWGYSQGAMLLPRIASKTNIPKFLIAKSPEIISVTSAAAFSDSLRVVNSGNPNSNGHIAANSHREVKKMISNGAKYKEVENYIQQNAQKYSFMNQTGLYSGLTIDKNEFDGFYWKGRTENFYSFWKEIRIPTLVLLGERDDLINTEKNKLLLNNLSNEYIEIVDFPLANHHLKKTFNPTMDSEFDFPRLIEGYTENVEEWIEKEITKR